VVEALLDLPATGNPLYGVSLPNYLCPGHVSPANRVRAGTELVPWLAQNLFREGVYWGHYEQLLSTPRYVRNLLNSAITSLGGALVTTTFCALAGYAFARLRFQGRRGVLILLLGLMMLPGIVNLIPLYRLTSELLRLVPTGAAIIGDLNARQVANLLLLIAVYSAFGIPFGVWVMKSFYSAIPRDLEDAALVDGATPLQALRHVLLRRCVTFCSHSRYRGLWRYS